MGDGKVIQDRETCVCKGTEAQGWGGPGQPPAPPQLPQQSVPQAGCQRAGLLVSVGVGFRAN